MKIMHFLIVIFVVHNLEFKLIDGAKLGNDNSTGKAKSPNNMKIPDEIILFIDMIIL